MKRLLERGGPPQAKWVAFALLAAVWLSPLDATAAPDATAQAAPPGVAATDALQCSARDDSIEQSPAFFLTVAREVEPIRLLQDADLLAAPGGGSSSSDGISGGGLTYLLSDHWSANFKYKHAYLFDTASNDALRQSQYSEFSTDRERDVLNVDMSWRLSWSTLDLGYRFQSVRGAANGGTAAERAWLPDFEDSLHSLTLGVTKTWGGSP